VKSVLGDPFLGSVDNVVLSIRSLDSGRPQSSDIRSSESLSSGSKEVESEDREGRLRNAHFGNSQTDPLSSRENLRNDLLLESI